MVVSQQGRNVQGGFYLVMLSLRHQQDTFCWLEFCAHYLVTKENLHSFLFFHLVSFKEIVFCCSYNSRLFSSIIIYVLIKTTVLLWSFPSTLLVREKFPCWWGLWGWLNTWHLTPERRTWQFISYVYSPSGRRQMHTSWGHFCTQKQNEQGECERRFLQC